jgi:hypothetical protein
MKTTIFFCAAILAVSGCKSKDAPPEPPPQPALEQPPPPPAPEPAPKMSEMDRARLLSHIQTRNKMIRSEAQVDMKSEPPLDLISRALVEGGASEVGYLIAPSGSTFGFTAAGAGETFARAVGARVQNMLDEKLYKQFLTLARYNDFNGIRFEISFGQPSWFRAGVRGLSPTKLRVALEEMKVPEDEIARVLADAEKSGGQALGIDIIVVIPRGASLVVPVQVKALPDDVVEKKAAEGGAPVVERFVDWKDTVYVRRTGLEGVTLIDWQHAHGLKVKGAGKRLGKIHAFLETEAPTQIIWQSGHFGETLVYLYTEKVADILKPSP